MPWKETCVMDQRIVACLAGEESVAVLCRHFGISRKTGHELWARYRSEGASVSRIGRARRTGIPRALAAAAHC
jgi:hypothetical protein